MAVANAPTTPGPQLRSPDLKSPDISTLLSGYLTNSDVAQMTQQMLSTWVRNKQVFWTGNLRQEASKWAIGRKMTTLSMALGPLLRDDNPSRQGKKRLSKYMRGASALFAWFATADDFVTVVCHPPPEHVNPGGRTNFQLVELPILIGLFGGRTVPKIDFVHPTVIRAISFTYQFWPIDESDEWERRYGEEAKPKVKWLKRAVTNQTLELENVLRQLLKAWNKSRFFESFCQEVTQKALANFQRMKKGTPNTYNVLPK